MSQEQGKSAIMAIVRSRELIVCSGVVFMMNMAGLIPPKLQSHRSHVVQRVASARLD